ncbi:hypothetical protein PM10SUCC1_34620 [Propionigenium maris DSM 9537]|uniref:PucR C-terminal helix-turn-helix domain-containing protein n=1 Tax=Propionigenium maris DSM 9537 TaxID=1123000 RepID=A0A9W6LPM3_9FUSO|nr:PucR family transcriptional regulator [Propionigenium maris]GLI57948.1 hypothetical protein PM10SUCC1_34620 [Propionigenium maris DSM 9537]
MYITVGEMLELERFKTFKCIAGRGGFKRRVEKISLLDYEIVKPLESQFLPYEFSLSSLLGAKNNPELILMSVKYLFESGVSGLAIKNIYYDELPEEVIEYADEHEFPIFLFDNSVFFEDLITDVRDVLRDIERNRDRERKLDSLMEGDLSEKECEKLYNELSNYTDQGYIVTHLMNKKDISHIDNMKIIEGFRHRKVSTILSVTLYHRGIIVVYKGESFKLTNLVNDCYYIGLVFDDYIVGISGYSEESKQFKDACKQSIWSAKVAMAERKGVMAYEDIGVYKLLEPIIHLPLADQYIEEMLMPLKVYDADHGTELFQTAEVFIQYDGQIVQAAKALCQHSNTIRYRINKIKQLLGFEEREGTFFEHLSLAFRVYRIKAPLF